jgi:hypothetical protein
LARLAYAVADQPEPVDNNDDIRRRLTALRDSLRSSRLGRFKSADALRRFVTGSQIATGLEWDGRIEPLPITATFTTDHRLDFDAHFPTGVRPLCLVWAQFRLATAPGRAPFVNERFRLPDVSAHPAATARAASAVAALIAAADGGAGQLHAAASDESPFLAEFVPGKGLKVHCDWPAATNDRAVVELVYRTHANTWSRIRRPITLARVGAGRIGTALVSDFPWPTDAAPGPGRLMVRDFADEDLPLLSAAEVSQLFATESDFVALPAVRDGDKFRVEFRYPSEREFAADSKTAWLLRVAVPGEEGRPDA